MEDDHAHRASPDSRINRLLRSMLRRILTVWLVGFAMVTLATWLAGRGLFSSALMISMASGLIAVAAIWPIVWLVRRPSFSQSENGNRSLSAANSGNLVSALMAGIGLRLFGTVVLFLLCRYQMGQQLEAIAVLVGGWYVLLTSVEVTSIAKFNAEIHQCTGVHQGVPISDLMITAKNGIGPHYSTPAPTSLTE